MIVIGVFFPLDTSALNSVTNESAFKIGFTEGYQTMDVLASVIYAGVIISAVKAKGYVSLKDKTKVTFLSGVIAIVCLLLVYGGLVYLGATSGYSMSGDLKRTELLLYISNSILGQRGTVALSLCIALACLTTAIALVCATGTFFNQLTNGRLSYRIIVIITCILSGVLAVNGVDDIIDYAVPFLSFIYPITLTLIIYIVIFGKRVQKKAPFVAAILATSLVAILQLSIFIAEKVDKPICAGKINKIIEALPLNDYELPWLIPSFLTFVVVYLFGKKKLIMIE